MKRRKIIIIFTLMVCLLFNMNIGNTVLAGVAVNIYNKNTSNNCAQSLNSVEKGIFCTLRDDIITLANGNAKKIKSKIKDSSGQSIYFYSTAFKVTNKDVKALANVKIKASNNGKGLADKLKSKFERKYDMSEVMNSISYAYPNETFWYLTTVFNYDVNYTYKSGYAYIKSLTVRMVVGNEYRAYSESDLYDNTKLSVTSILTAKNSIKNANKIVKKYSNKSDYNKLYAYFNSIKKMNTYNDVGGEAADVLAWNYISVLDGDKNTNAQCEGYAKAFKLLCDLTSFKSSKVRCYYIKGDLYTPDGYSIVHAWNVVTLPDGNNYLVDITNCDDGAVGREDKLFPGTNGLVPLEGGSITEGFSYDIPDYGTIRYVPEKEALATYGSDDTSILNISTTQYQAK